MSSGSYLSRLRISGASGTGYAAIVMNNTSFADISECVLQNSYILLKHITGTVSNVNIITETSFFQNYTYVFIRMVLMELIVCCQ